MLAVAAGRRRRLLRLSRAQSRPHRRAAGETTSCGAAGCNRVRRVVHLFKECFVYELDCTYPFCETLPKFFLFTMRYNGRCGQLAFILCMKFYFFYEK